MQARENSFDFGDLEPANAHKPASADITDDPGRQYLGTCVGPGYGAHPEEENE